MLWSPVHFAFIWSTLVLLCYLDTNCTTLEFPALGSQSQVYAAATEMLKHRRNSLCDQARVSKYIEVNKLKLLRLKGED